MTRALVQLLEREPLGARIEHILPASARRKVHRARQLTSLARSLVSPLPSKAVLTYSRRFLNDVRRSLDARKFDLVLLNGSDLLWLLPHLPQGIPRILVAHNIEHQLFLSQINSVYKGSRILRSLLMRDWRRLRDYEMSGMRSAENVIFLSSQDAEFALGEDPGLQRLIMPPTFDYPSAQGGGSKDLRGGIDIGFMGHFGWWPNREGLRWFLKEVFPHTTDDTRLHLFGEQALDAAPPHPRIVVHGFLPELQDIWSICDFMICPIHSGGGVNVKFAEAVYNRMPVLASSFGARGLPLKPDAGIVLLDNAQEWVAFLCSPAARVLRAQILPAALSEQLSMDSHRESVHRFVQNVIKRHSRSNHSGARLALSQSIPPNEEQ